MKIITDISQNTGHVPKGLYILPHTHTKKCVCNPMFIAAVSQDGGNRTSLDIHQQRNEY